MVVVQRLYLAIEHAIHEPDQLFRQVFIAHVEVRVKIFSWLESTAVHLGIPDLSHGQLSRSEHVYLLTSRVPTDSKSEKCSSLISVPGTMTAIY